MNTHRCSQRGKTQRGVVMLFGLIALVIMLVGAVAIVRSVNTSLANAGNLGFKRDLTNQGDRAIATVLTLVQSGALGTEAARQSSDTSRNYSATLLPSNAQGLPTALLASDTGFATVGATSNDISVAGMGVTLRYVVDRLCVNTGLAAPSHCTMDDNQVPMGGNGGGGAIAEDPVAGNSGAVPRQVVYRLSIRVDGPRQTQAFFQTTFTL
jgi:hypothetical protein